MTSSLDSSASAAITAAGSLPRISIGKGIKMFAFGGLACVGLAVHAQNLIVNGSFESFASNNTAPGWTVTNNLQSGPYNDPCLYIGAFGGSDGPSCVVLNAGDSAPAASLSQTFTTVSGQSYALKFDYVGGPPWRSDLQSIDFTVSNSTLSPQTARGDASGDWKTYTYSFVATGTSSTITFTDNATNITYSEDGALDNVRVVADGPALDTVAPVISSVTPSVATLWPANHKLVAVTLAVSASDNVNVTSLRIVSVASSEPDNGLGDGDTANDVQITGNLSLSLRAERAGNGPGRTYMITVEARDAAGNVTTKSTTVFVPKSQSGK